MLELLTIAFKCAVVGFVFSAYLIKEGEVLGFWGRFINKYLVKRTVINCKEVIKESVFYKPFGACEKCVSGQFSLWAFVFNERGNFKLDTGNIIDHLGTGAFVICLAILLTEILVKLKERV